MNDRDLLGTDWDKNAALASLAVRRDVEGERSEAQVAEDIFREALPLAALQIVHLSEHSGNERLRADLARYVVERNLGSLKDVVRMDQKDPLQALVQSITNVENEQIEHAKAMLQGNWSKMRREERPSNPSNPSNNPKSAPGSSPFPEAE